ncbi:G-protein coupled receptor family C group 6 member A-like, partial [Archocentrus centrarchus]|uniref:G-protein coupled receptor family C group 6 member A-like n=1 Tax=Archocentrus centrarchus TaxID=63155 RepID=UPI0011EA39D3
VLYLCGSTMFLMWFFVMSVFHSSLGENSCLRAYSPGDIIIGGLFPIHLKTNRTETPGPVSCSDYDLQMFLRSQVMIYAIREISLPDITIGYDIYDTCGDVSLAIMATLELLKNQSDPQSCLLPAEPQTKVVIGETSSEVSIAVARIVALSSVAQISYASTSELLSRKFKFPTFLRTVPSDEYQTKGIVELVKTFHWQTVFIVGSDDEYGKYGSDGLVNTFSETNVCVEAVRILSADFVKNDSQTQRKLNELLGDIKNSSAEAIILFTKDSNVKIILEAAIKDKVNRTWIASDSWSNSPKLSAMPGIEHIGQVFGFIFKQSEVPGFKDYVMSMFNGTKNDILNYHLTQYPLCSNQSLEVKQCLDLSSLLKDIHNSELYSIYLAVQVIAEGLKSLLKCDNHQCERSSKFTASELLSEIKKVNFTVNTTHLFFSNGDPSLGYDIIYWNMSGTVKQGANIECIGEYQPDGKIKVPVDLLKHLINETGSVYNCSKRCDPGQELKKETKMCCPVCIPCASGEFSPGNSSTCKRCDEWQYSSEQRNECLNKTDEFLQWSDPFSIILCSLAAVGIILTVVFTVLFAVYLRTPIVNAVGGYLCFLELFSLLAGFCLIFTFIGKPTKSSDCMGLPLFGIAFTLCIACILANLFQILVGFNFDLQRGSCIKKLNKPLLLVTIISGVQLALSVSWLIKEPPTPKVNTDFSDKTILHQCEVAPLHHFLAMLAYNGFLGLICFMFAFKGKQLPDLYKNASLITIGMLMFIVIWIIFLPIYLTLTGMYKPAVEAAAILTSCFSILGCHLAPKCYIMLFRKELNHQNAITEYIRKHYERKGISVVQS